jgi:serine/threonine protein kinase
MGTVWRATDTKLGRDVAIKVLPAAVSADPDRLRRFESEARAAGLLNHPNILSIYGFGEHDGAPFVVSELLEGATLRERLGGTALSPRRAIDYALQIATMAPGSDADSEKIVTDAKWECHSLEASAKPIFRHPNGLDPGSSHCAGHHHRGDAGRRRTRCSWPH